MLKKILPFLIFLSAAIAIFLDFTENLSYFKFFKPLTTILIMLLPILYWNKENRKYHVAILVALLFCLGGDIFLLNPDNFVFGLASFLVGHLLFSYAFISIDGFNKNLIPLLILGVIASSYVLFLKPNLGDLFIPVLVYIAAIVFMNWQAICLYLNDRRNVFLMLGVAATLFTFSDSVIAFNKFVQPFEWSGILILSTYWLSIFLIGYSCKWQFQ